MQYRILAYFDWIKGDLKEEIEINVDGDLIRKKVWNREPVPPTITGLCFFLGFESRQSFYDYEPKKDFSYTIKRGRIMIKLAYEQALWNDKCTGPIFALKNLGFSDKTDVTTNGGDINIPVATWVKTQSDKED